MAKEKRSLPTVMLIYGGAGREREVSLSGASYVRGLIDREKYRLLETEIDADGGWYARIDGERTPVFPVRLGDRSGLLAGGEIIGVDCALPLLHGDLGEDGRIQGLLECAGIPFVGADTSAGAVTSDKVYTKAVASAMGIPTAEWLSFDPNTPTRDAKRLAEERLDYPMFIKPARLGSSIGAAAVYTPDEFDAAYCGARLTRGGSILVEELIEPKRELEIAMLDTPEGRVLSDVGEVVCRGFYDYEKKYDPSLGISTVTSAELDEGIRLRLCEYAERLCSALSLGGLARIDFFLSDGRLLFNEINVMPGFTPTSLYPRMMNECGITPTKLIGILIEGVLR